MRQIAIDLETFGTSSNSVIIAIGAAEFDLYTGEILHRFYAPVDPDSCGFFGMKYDGSTIRWWLDQSKDAVEALGPPEEALGIQLALVALNEWVTMEEHLPDKDVAVYGNGSKFDLTILENAYKATGIKVPWSYRNELCGRTLRTLRYMLGYDVTTGAAELEGTKHKADDDAAWLAGQISAVVQNLSTVCAETQRPLPVFAGAWDTEPAEGDSPDPATTH